MSGRGNYQSLKEMSKDKKPPRIKGVYPLPDGKTISGNCKANYCAHCTSLKCSHTCHIEMSKRSVQI